MANQLIYLVESNVLQREVMARWLTEAGYLVREFESGGKCPEHFEDELKTIFMEINPKDPYALEILKSMRKAHSGIPITVVTPSDGLEETGLALQFGAFDFITKPVTRVRLLTTTLKAVQAQAHQNQVLHLQDELQKSWADENLIGQSDGMRRVREQIRDVSAIQMNVLIDGETGSGREWVAKAVHYNSPNREQNLVSLYCDAVPETLAESELFGHEKSAFPGADESRIGKLETANGGSLLLKEVDKMTPPLQNGLLRFLEDNQFQRLGGTKTIKSKMRMIATAGKNLKSEVESGTFNEKLFFRLNVYPIHLPPLRERSEDIPLLAQSFLRKHQGLLPKQITSVSSHALEAMMRYKWPGNVRQLENVICRAFVTARGEALQIENLPEDVRISRPRYISGFSFPESGQAPPQEDNAEAGESVESTKLAESAESKNPPTFETIERYAMFQALDRSNGNIAKAARELGISRATLYRKVKKYRSL